MGLDVATLQGPFEPEAGAYDASAAHAHGHRMITITATHGTITRTTHHDDRATTDDGAPRASGHERRAGARRAADAALGARSRRCGQAAAAGFAAAVDAARLAEPARGRLQLLRRPGVGRRRRAGRGRADARSAGCWTSSCLGLARSDLPVVAKPLAAWRRGDVAHVAALNRWFASTRETAELRRRASRRAARSRFGCATATAPRRSFASSRRCGPPRPGRWRSRSPEPAPARRRATCCVAFAAGWAENMVQAATKAVPLGQVPAQRVLAALAAEIPARRRGGAAARRRRHAGLHADARHPVGAARSAVLAPVPLLNALRRLARHERHCTRSPAEPARFRRCASASAARSARARRRWSRCSARRCASAGTSSSSPTTSTPRKTSAC